MALKSRNNLIDKRFYMNIKRSDVDGICYVSTYSCKWCGVTMTMKCFSGIIGIWEALGFISTRHNCQRISSSLTRCKQDLNLLRIWLLSFLALGCVEVIASTLRRQLTHMKKGMKNVSCLTYIANNPSSVTCSYATLIDHFIESSPVKVLEDLLWQNGSEYVFICLTGHFWFWHNHIVIHLLQPKALTVQ